MLWILRGYMSLDILESYTYLWEDTWGRYLLVQHPKNPEKYVICMKLAMSINQLIVDDNVYEDVVAKMLEAGAETRTQPVDFKDEFRIERLWTDRVNEFAIVPSGTNPQWRVIFHKNLKEGLSLPHLSRKQYKDVVDKMVKAGAEVWSKL